jgi:hypothetical protein
MSAQKRVLPRPELEKQLSNALKDTFPASDPVTIGEPTSTEPDRPEHRRAPLIDKQLVKDLAKKAGRKIARKAS